MMAKIRVLLDALTEQGTFSVTNCTAPQQALLQPRSPEVIAAALAAQRRIMPPHLDLVLAALEQAGVRTPAAPDVPVSDHGIEGAVPLPEPTWRPEPEPEDWAEQNRKINDLLMRRV